jgi:hypothetical protein
LRHFILRYRRRQLRPLIGRKPAAMFRAPCGQRAA